jgi:hypothetical protein
MPQLNMSARLFTATLLSILACATSDSDRPDSVGTSTSTSTDTSASVDTVSTSDTTVSSPEVHPSPGRPQEIYIDSVLPTNPVVVFGRARTFENTVQVRVRNAAGDVIGQKFTTSTGEMGHHNPFSVQLWIVRDPGSSLTVEAFEYSAKDGSERSLTSMKVPYDAAAMQVTLMLPVGDDCKSTRAFTRPVPKTRALARLLVEALVAGADSAEKAAGAVAPFPRGSGVNSVVLRDGTLTVDFNERLQNVGGSCAATAIRQSVTRTLQQLRAVKRVVITAGGSEKLALQP